MPVLHDIGFDADEGGTHFSDQFLFGVTLPAKTVMPGEGFPVQSGGMAGGMAQLVEEGAIVGIPVSQMASCVR